MSLKDKALSKLGMEENEDLGLEDIAALILKFEGAVVDRKTFLQEVLQGKYAQEVIDKAISEGPAAAGFTKEDMEGIARGLMEQAKAEVESYSKKDEVKETLQDEESNIIEKAKETVETVKANQYQQEWSKLSQKLLYLYGFPEINISDDDILTGDKSKLLMMLSGAAMSGIENADEALKAMAQALPQLKDKAISTRQLDSDEISEVLKKWVARSLGKGLTITALDNIPLLGDWLRTENYSDKMEEAYGNLMNALSDTVLSNPQHEATPKELAYAEKLLAMVRE